MSISDIIPNEPIDITRLKNGRVAYKRQIQNLRSSRYDLLWLTRKFWKNAFKPVGDDTTDYLTLKQEKYS